MSARCWTRRRTKTRFDIALRKVTRDPWLTVPLTPTASLVGVARSALLASINNEEVAG